MPREREYETQKQKQKQKQKQNQQQPGTTEEEQEVKNSIFTPLAYQSFSGIISIFLIPNFSSLF